MSRNTILGDLGVNLLLTALIYSLFQRGFISTLIFFSNVCMSWRMIFWIGMIFQTYSHKRNPWDRTVGWLKQQLTLMTGGGKRCWQRQQQHVIGEWKASSRLRLNPALWSEIFFFSPIWWNSIVKAGGFSTKQVEQLTWKLTEPCVIVCQRRGTGCSPCDLIFLCRRLPHINAGVLLQACSGRALQTLFPFQGCHWTLCQYVTSTSGSVSGLAMTCFCCVCVYVHVNM